MLQILKRLYLILRANFWHWYYARKETTSRRQSVATQKVHQLPGGVNVVEYNPDRHIIQDWSLNERMAFQRSLAQQMGAAAGINEVRRGLAARGMQDQRLQQAAMAQRGMLHGSIRANTDRR